MKISKNILKSSVILFAALVALTGGTSSYFTSQVSVTGNQFSTGTWPEKIVINEVYYDVDARTYPHGQGVKTEEEGKNEWIELYNPNNFAVNIKDWSITDNSGIVYQINPNVSIPAHGFALLSHDNDTWHFWGDPSALTINLGGSFSGGWLSNSGDRVILKDALGNVVDQMSYGTDTYAFSPSCPDVAEGHSLERHPDGADTNTKNDFVDRTTPTPGA